MEFKKGDKVTSAILEGEFIVTDIYGDTLVAEKGSRLIQGLFKDFKKVEEYTEPKNKVRYYASVKYINNEYILTFTNLNTLKVLDKFNLDEVQKDNKYLYIEREE